MKGTDQNMGDEINSIVDVHHRYNVFNQVNV